MPRRIALIMAGGGGTRLWPASTDARPKPLIPDLPEPGTTLLATTVERLAGLVVERDVFVVTTRSQIEGLRAALPAVPEANFIIEPCGRNTAPCVALSLHALSGALGPDADEATVLILPADHHVARREAFVAHLGEACEQAETGAVIVTLGIEPTHAATGYGYVERGDEPRSPAKDGAPQTFDALCFVEKPNRERAERYLASGKFLWNAGIFVAPLRRLAREFARLEPQMWQALADALAAKDPEAAVSRAYADLDSRPIDIAIMEKQTDMRVIPASVGWSDLGTWRSIADLFEADADGNVILGDPRRTIAESDRNCLVWNEDGSVVTFGLDDVAVIQSRGRVLVCPRSRVEELKAAVARLDED